MQMEDIQDFFKGIMHQKLIDLSTREIAPNMLAQQQFEFRLESGVENAYLYHDELVSAVALSVVPPHIHEL